MERRSSEGGSEFIVHKISFFITLLRSQIPFCTGIWLFLSLEQGQKVDLRSCEPIKRLWPGKFFWLSDCQGLTLPVRGVVKETATPPAGWAETAVGGRIKTL